MKLRPRALVKAAAAHNGPVFIRTGRPKVPIIYEADQKFEIGKAVDASRARMSRSSPRA